MDDHCFSYNTEVQNYTLQKNTTICFISYVLQIKGNLKKVRFYAGRSHNPQGFLMHRTFQTLIVQVFISINQKTVICNEPKILVQWFWIRSWSHTYVYDVGGHKTFSFMNNQMVAMLQLLLLLSMFVQVSKEDHFKDVLEDNVINPYAWWGATCMLGEDNWTSKNTKGWSVSKCRTQFYLFIAFRSFFTWTWCWHLYWIGSSQEHDLDTRLHTSWRFIPFTKIWR